MEKDKKKDKEEYAMLVSWGSNLEESDDEDVYETAFMDIKDLNIE